MMKMIAARQIVALERGGNAARRVLAVSSAVGSLDRPTLFLHVEGAALLAVALAFYAMRGGNWWMLALLFLVPDVSALGYFGGKTIGAACYNVAHTIATPLVAATIALLIDASSLTMIAAIWLMHIGWDRLIGYSLQDVSARLATDDAVVSQTGSATSAMRGERA